MIIDFVRNVYGNINFFGWIMMFLGGGFTILDFILKSKPSQWLVKKNINMGTWIISIYLVFVALSQTPYFEENKSEEYNALVVLLLSSLVYYIVVHRLLLRAGYETNNKPMEYSEKEKMIFLQVLFNKILIVSFISGLFLMVISSNKAFYIVCLVLLPIVKDIRESYIENKEIINQIKK